MKPRHQKIIVGWIETVEFPDWKIAGIRAKIDTGARTSALHVENLEELSRGRVRFDVMLGRRTPFRRRTVTARVVKAARVRSSNGRHEERYFVRTAIQMGGHLKEIELSLVSRGKMLFRMLLGRKALEHDFLVDVSHRHVVTTRIRAKAKIPKSS